jgi:exosortase A-associated hydrolase 1
MTEEAIFFDCQGERLLGVLHHAHGPGNEIGVVLVVGGPQYRVGSHRQFVLLARSLASAGIAVFRFDYRGMGDSIAEPRDFEHISDDIQSALNTFNEKVSGLKGTVLWGLCDAATANAFYALGDERVVGQIALNPWVRTSEGEAQAFIKHYYLKRVLSPSFWRKVFSMRFNVLTALKDFLNKLGDSRANDMQAAGDERPLPERLRVSQIGFAGPTLLILSGQDLTAREYEDRVAESPDWQGWMHSADVTLHRLAEADHTFSRAAWRDLVADWSRDWILRLADRG